MFSAIKHYQHITIYMRAVLLPHCQIIQVEDYPGGRIVQLLYLVIRQQTLAGGFSGN